MVVEAAAPIFDVVLARGLGDQMFYRQPNGWITSGPIGKGHSRKFAYQRQGWTPLEEYGRFDLLDYYANQPLEVLFLRGGAKELPVEQVKALGFHLHPPLLPNCQLQLGAKHAARMEYPNHYNLCWQDAQPVTFPQLEGQTFQKVDQCEFCERDNFASDASRSQHMRVLHKDEMASIAAAREMAKGMQSAVAGLMVSSHPANYRPHTELSPASLPFACGVAGCGESFEKVSHLSAHVKLHVGHELSEEAAA